MLELKNHMPHKEKLPLPVAFSILPLLGTAPVTDLSIDRKAKDSWGFIQIVF